MKTLFLSLMLLASSAAFAGNEGPQAAPVPPPNPTVAKASVHSFFTPQDSAKTTIVEVLRSGQVKLSLQYFDASRNKTSNMLRLSPELTRKIVALVAKVEAGKLVDPTPEDPGCFDAPYTSFKAVKDNGQEIEIAANSACKHMLKQPRNGADAELERILKSLLDLAWSAQTGIDL
ncbi:MAG TPA: hypothetical protein VM432_01275 [Bdellovibrionales bacterium]|nr:hypothetical protein [Bdellovibrionales bacterium]